LWDDFPSEFSDSEDPDPIDASPAIDLAIDRDLSADLLKVVVSAAKQAGAASIYVAGQRSQHSPPVRAPGELSALLSWAGKPRGGSCQIVLETALPEGYAESDSVLWHGTVGNVPEVLVQPREGSELEPFSVVDNRNEDEFVSRPPVGVGPQRGPVYLELESSATAGTVLRIADLLAAWEFRPILVTTNIPGHPERPVGRPAPGIADDYQ
jgi:hypothetical protein